MRIDTTGLYSSRKTSKAAPDPGSRPTTRAARRMTSDDVTVSARARLLALGNNALGAAPEIRASVVEAAREKLGNGGGAYDGGEIARAMIDSIADTSNASGEAN